MIGKLFKKAASRTDVSVEIPAEDAGVEELGADSDVDVAVNVSARDAAAAARGLGKVAKGLKKDGDQGQTARG
ncbi:Uncharacterised protein [Actinomyces howellii]|uniref:Uncharacterized protein n=2 Tax=Actinomyces howellii TaxID=52771 RepID=A0A448HH88_9ACTO|nr:Uncharacterised protein [Actinomyces howellii]